jgi:LuxR family maltose regulon positive regulatory protein
VVERPRLLRRLEELTQAPLTVVAAPTGYGKTTLLASWAGSTSRQVAWVSVGSRDLDADGFWTVVAAALEQAEPRLRLGLVREHGAGDQAVRIATALGSLSSDLTLVLDGYEQAVQAGLDAAFGRFLDLAPEELHAVVSTRREPKLALPLRRAHGTVAELGLDELSLDEDETAAVLRRTSGRDTASADAAALAERTEGWPAAVYLAALAARTAQRPQAVVEGFSGAAREICDYLRLELLDAQPDDLLRSFQLETSLLERLTAPLCDALLRRNDSEEMLRALVRGGAFLVPLEGAGHGYRYVRPVGEFLRAELVRVAPDRVDDLHRRAAAACERAGLFDEAAAHARAAAGDDEAGTLLARHALELVRDGHAEHIERVLETRAGAAAAERRPALRAELRCLAGARADLPALDKAAERVALLSAGLPSGPVRALVLSTAQAAQAYALLLSGSVAEAYEAGAAAYASADPDAAAPAGQAAAVASLAASRLGLGAAAAPLARAGASALARRGIRSGTAAALSLIAAAAVAEALSDVRRAERLCVDALERTGEPQSRALALLRLARLRMTAPPAARSALAEARVELSSCRGAALLETLAAEIEAELGSRERAQPATGELSPAEQRVLRLLATRLTQREIANELYVSLNTVKTHARVIYRKLGVASRSAAVAAARELNLV